MMPTEEGRKKGKTVFYELRTNYATAVIETWQPERTMAQRALAALFNYWIPILAVSALSSLLL